VTAPAQLRKLLGSRRVLDSAHVRAKKGAELTGPSPVDRGEPSSRTHVLLDANGLPLLVGVSAGNGHDSEALKPVVEGHRTRHDSHRGRYFKPRRLHADQAYDRADLRRWLRGKRIGVRIARKGIESGQRSGRRSWVIERTMSWLSDCRRLSPRYERDPRDYLAFLGLAAALRCSERLIRHTT
jgi:transposase